ncbi:MAG TPA: hypothetical protein VK698_36090 [Kofleriaceae bacterium]|nr:hypothetical protein [Kofleriaceae bacterium]
MSGPRVARIAGVLMVAAALAGGCKRNKIEVVASDKDLTGDYGRHALRAAVQKFRATPRSSEAYRALAVEVERLRPSFNQDVADEAERNLVFLALGPLEEQLERPLEEQMRALALTVWPTALHVEPKPGEDVRRYLERACAGPLAAECKYIVPEYWPLMLSHSVWRRLKDRSRVAYSACRPCAQEPSYAALLEQFDQHLSALDRRAHAEEGQAARDAWPEAGENAREWSGAPTIDLVPDPPLLAGQPIESDWRVQVRNLRKSLPPPGDVLGVHLKPRAEVRQLRDVLRAAAAAGYREVALQARRREYPYQLVEYRLAARGAMGRPVDARDPDNIQFLVRGLDAAAERTGAKTLRLSAR